MITIAELTQKMIAHADGNLHDICHFLKVWGYARTIGQLEGLDAETQFILETAALVHDIAIPLCRKKYGSTSGKYQELEGYGMAKDFLKDTGMTEAQIERVAFLVGHHHTFNAVDGPDYQILLEADYLVNADEHDWSRENVAEFIENVAKTEAGKALLRSVYGV